MKHTRGSFKWLSHNQLAKNIISSRPTGSSPCTFPIYCISIILVTKLLISKERSESGGDGEERSGIGGDGEEQAESGVAEVVLAATVVENGSIMAAATVVENGSKWKLYSFHV